MRKRAEVVVTLTDERFGQLIDENRKLRAKNARQRTELKRMSRRLEAMWEGVRFSHRVAGEAKARMFLMHDNGGNI